MILYVNPRLSISQLLLFSNGKKLEEKQIYEFDNAFLGWTDLNKWATTIWLKNFSNIFSIGISYPTNK